MIAFESDFKYKTQTLLHNLEVLYINSSTVLFKYKQLRHIF